MDFLQHNTFQPESNIYSAVQVLSQLYIKSLENKIGWASKGSRVALYSKNHVEFCKQLVTCFICVSVAELLFPLRPIESRLTWRDTEIPKWRVAGLCSYSAFASHWPLSLGGASVANMLYRMVFPLIYQRIVDYFMVYYFIAFDQ